MDITAEIPGPDGFEEIAHTADRALRIHGRDLSELLIHAARGLNRLMAPAAPEASAGWARQRIEIEAGDIESLLVAWLSELAYLAERHGLVFERFELEAVAPTCVRADAFGRQAAFFETYVKAVTYHDLAVVPSADGLSATVVFDV
jgi:SHS2 domain-containing protein